MALLQFFDGEPCRLPTDVGQWCGGLSLPHPHRAALVTLRDSARDSVPRVWLGLDYRAEDDETFRENHFTWVQVIKWFNTRASFGTYESHTSV